MPLLIPTDIKADEIMARKAFKPWKNLGVLSPKSVTREVQGERLSFYPISMGMMFKMQGLIGPIAKAISILFGGNHEDRATLQETVQQGSEDGGGEINRVHMEAIAPELAAHRDKIKAGAVAQLVDLVADDNTKRVLAQVIMDSMREQFTREDIEDGRAIHEFIEGEDGEDGERQGGLTLDLLIELLKGVMLANEGVFGPLGKEISQAVRAKTNSMLSDELSAPLASSEEQEESESSTPGSSSTRPSSPQLVSDVTPTGSGISTSSPSSE